MSGIGSKALVPNFFQTTKSWYLFLLFFGSKTLRSLVVWTKMTCPLMGWFKHKRVRLLDANAFEKLHRVLVTYLGKCTFFLVGELACFDGKLVRTLCYASLSEYAISSLKDQIYKVTCISFLATHFMRDHYTHLNPLLTLQFGRRICSSIFSLQEDMSSLIMDISICVLDSIALECKVTPKKLIHERSLMNCAQDISSSKLLWYPYLFCHCFEWKLPSTSIT